MVGEAAVAEHVTVDLAANRIEQAAERRGLDAARALLSRTLGRSRSALELDFNARLCTELRERDLRRRAAARRPMNLWRI